MYRVISLDPSIQSFYEQCRENGESHAIAEICALQQAPGLVTDTRFRFGHCNENQFEREPEVGERYKKIAERRGVTISGDSIYIPGLASFPGDPEARIRDRGDIKRVATKKGYGCEGVVRTKARQPEKDPMEDAPLVAKDILYREVMRAIQEDPERMHDLEPTKQEVIQKIKPPWRK